MIRLVGSQKGGTGKSTVATNLAAAYAVMGRDVVLVDADPQRSAARWHGDRVEAGHIPVMACVEKRENVRDTLSDLNGRYEEVIVDVAGHDSRELRTAMLAAHQMIVVSRPSQFDLDTLAHMSEVIEQARDLNPNLDVRGLLTQVPTNPNVKERVDGGAYLADFPTLRPLETVIFERKAYRDVIAEGLGVVEWSNPKARTEIENLVAEVEN